MKDLNNPYAPPSVTSAEPPAPPANRGMFSEQNWEVMTELIRWVKKVAQLSFFLGVLYALVILFMMGPGRELLGKQIAFLGDLSKMTRVDIVIGGTYIVELLIGAFLLGKVGSGMLGSRGADRGSLIGGFRELRFYFLVGSGFLLLHLLIDLAVRFLY